MPAFPQAALIMFLLNAALRHFDDNKLLLYPLTAITLKRRNRLPKRVSARLMRQYSPHALIQLFRHRSISQSAASHKTYFASLHLLSRAI